jgi:predicted aspartyl protease
LNHLVAVNAEINGKGPYLFVVDTGAAGALRVSPELADALHLPGTGTIRDGDPSGRDSVETPLVRVATVALGNHRFTNVEATVRGQLPGVHADGVIGLDLFGGWTVTIDYPGQELRLSHEPLKAGGGHVVSFTTEHGVPRIAIGVAGRTLQADLDTGSPALFTTPSSLNLPLRTQPRVTGQGQSASGTFEISSADLNGDLVVAGWSVPNPTLDIADRFPGPSIGSRLLRTYAVSFDLAGRRLALDK